MNTKCKIVNKYSNESLHSLLDHELHNSPSGSNFVCVKHFLLDLLYILST